MLTLFSSVIVYIEIFSDMCPVWQSESGVSIQSGVAQWTDAGRAHYIYEDQFEGIDIEPTNTVLEDGLSQSWQMLIIHDVPSNDESEIFLDSEEDDSLFEPSDGTAIGTNFIGYYGTVYENGVIEVQNAL